MQQSATPNNESKYVLVHRTTRWRQILKSGELKTGQVLKINNYMFENPDDVYHAHIFFSPVLKTKTGKYLVAKSNLYMYFDPYIILKDRYWYSNPEWSYGLCEDTTSYPIISSNDPNGNAKIEKALDDIFSKYNKTTRANRMLQTINRAEIFVEPDSFETGTIDIRSSLLYPPFPSPSQI